MRDYLVGLPGMLKQTGFERRFANGRYLPSGSNLVVFDWGRVVTAVRAVGRG